MHMNLDPFLVDKIVDEVKSQGVFDQFRKDSMADVDTKPAYQNLRQRVETTVTKFLSEQIWTPELNKNQLREKLRKHITEAGFLDTGVERIVDQVVNPKISTVFQPKIEDIAYKFLGIEKPQIKTEEKSIGFTNGDLSLKTDFLPTDLEAVSPDSDKITDEKSESKEDLLNDSDDKNEEFESPPFEPLEGLGRPPTPDKKEDSNHSQLSGISGLTSQDSIEETKENVSIAKEVDVTQESELSEVSSNSRLSIVTNGGEDSKPEIKEEADVGISEEAQMPKFNDSASSNLENCEHLHFDIKKEEIKFEGTDWKSEKRDYFSCISDNLALKSEIKQEYEDANPEKEQTNKTDDASASSNLTYSTDTQVSATSKLVDFEKFEKEMKSRSDEYNEENNQQNIQEQHKSQHPVQEKHSSTPASKDRGRSHKKSHKKSSDREKYNSSENGSRLSDTRHDSYSPRSYSSSKKHKRSDDYKSKSHSHKSKHSREKDSKSRDRSRNRKHKSDKDNGKSADYCSNRKKRYRRKSTDSNDDADASKDTTSKNNSTSSLDKMEGGKESNSSNSSNYSSNTSGSVEETSTRVATDRQAFEIIDDNSESCGNYSKPVILDDLLGNDAKSNIELIIGAKIVVDTKRREGRVAEGRKRKFSEDEADLEFFEINSVEEEECQARIKKLSAVIEMQPENQYLYIMDCSKDFKMLFESFDNKKKVVEIEAGNSETTDSFNSAQNKDTKVIKGNGSFTKTKKNGHNNFDSLCNIISPYGKRNSNLDNYYQPAYCVFSDEKIRNNCHSLIIDCFEYSSNESINKKLKTSHFTTESFAKVSPTPSELSVGSKENEFLGKNIKEKRKEKLEIATTGKKSISLKASQRYSSEDLYKPRPVLSQRSKRRAIETEVA